MASDAVDRAGTERRSLAEEPATQIVGLHRAAERDAGPPTELRVHGVSGTPAEDMLDRPIISRVAGDNEAGFFRPRPEYGAHDSAPAAPASRPTAGAT